MENLNPSVRPQKRKLLGFFETSAQPGKLILIFAIVVSILMFGLLALFTYAKTAPENSFLSKALSFVGIGLEEENDSLEESITKTLENISQECTQDSDCISIEKNWSCPTYECESCDMVILPDDSINDYFAVNKISYASAHNSWLASNCPLDYECMITDYSSKKCQNLLPVCLDCIGGTIYPFETKCVLGTCANVMLEEKTEDEEETDVESNNSEESLGRSIVYTFEDQLMFDSNVDDESSAVQIDTLDLIMDTSGMIIPNTYPKFSPDGTMILYSIGAELRLYDLISDSVTVLYTGGDGVNSNIRRACWKDDDEVFFESNYVDADVNDLQVTYSIKVLNIDTMDVNDWGTFNMDTGFGGYSADPSDWLLWHFSDLIGISYEMYWDSTNVYVQTFQDSQVWVSISNGGSGVVVSESVVLPLTDYENLEMDMVLNSTYESDSSSESYLLENLGMSPISLYYYDSNLIKNGSTIYSDLAHGFWNLWDDEENNYVYFTQIENSNSYQTCIEGEFDNMENYYPSYEIMRYDTDSGDYELLVYGLSFDLY